MRYNKVFYRLLPRGIGEPDHASEIMIVVKNLVMRLTAGGHSITILDDITLEIPAKQVVAIVGPSGSGKSTLLGLMAGLDKPTSGSIWLDGVELTSLQESPMARYRRGRHEDKKDQHA